MNNEEFKKQLKIRAFNLARKIIKLVDQFPQKRASWVIADQIIRSSTSIGANIIESQAASSKKDFVNFLNHALKSGNETKFWLALTKDLDQKLITQVDDQLKEVDEITKILGSSIATLKGKKRLKTNNSNF